MKLKNTIIGIIVILLFSVPVIFDLYGEYWWFLSVNYSSVFLTALFTSIFLGAVFAIVFFAFGLFNIIVADKLSRKKGKNKVFMTLVVLLAIFALFIGYAFAHWDLFLQYMNPSSFAVQDPIFGLDVGFYMFQLPFINLITDYLFAMIILTILFTVGTYLTNTASVSHASEEAFEYNTPAPMRKLYFRDFMKKTTPHISFLAGLLFFVLGFRITLLQYGLLYSGTGISFGAGLTDLSVSLPLLSVLVALAVLIGIAFIINIKLNKTKLLKIGIGVFIAISLIGLVATGITQAFIVKPNESNIESPYIERTIQNTLSAYGLGDIEESIFPVSYNLTQGDIMDNAGTINNIRHWDYRPLITTYNQLQLFRTYYEFNGVDIDRYMLDGEYKQVMISPREMNINNLPSSANTWVNRHLVYTHGYGVVMNPVDKNTKEGLPELYIKNIPPQSDFLYIERPEIYYGELANDYIIVKSTTDELDYPSGDKNIYTSYIGSGGISLSDFLSRLTYAVKFGSIEFLVSGSIKPESKVLFHRNVYERVKQIAPFLLYDPDPYIVIADGKLFWVVDAYTVSDKYPYSKPVFLRGGSSFNYIRNSVKVVVDAYNGDVTYYVIEPEDPVIKTFQAIFPELFTDFSEMSDALKSHMRYPEGLFRIQAEIYSTFHMKDPKVFYNKEDVWVQPEELYRGDVQEMEPYYIIMKLPGEAQEEFIMMQPFTPRNKQNMIAWMAARSDFPNYGKIRVFRFSKQELIYGPLQIEARIDQDADISQLFTLWGQSGSSVIRGNTLVIPIENSIMYIEPVFLEATEKGTLPQFKRIIVAYGDKLTMQPTLKEALDVIFGSKAPSTGGTGSGSDGTVQSSEEILSRIAELYDQAQESLREGDFEKYGRLINEIGELVKNV